jgi:hypothetical protein
MARIALTMSRLQKLKKLLFDELSNGLASYGFRLNASRQAFYSPTQFGRAVFHLAFIRHAQTDFDVTADVALRVDAVEDLIFPDTNYETATVGCELGNISIGRQRRWNVRDETDLRPVTDSIEEGFTSIALPYITRYSNLEEMYTLLSGNERQNWLHAPLHGARCQRAVALGVVLKKQDLTQLIARCEAFLQQTTEFERQSFAQFIQKLHIR